MSILQYPDAINAPDLQVWNNATFDNGDTDETVEIKASWCSTQLISISRSESLASLASDSSKENQSPAFNKSNVSLKSPTPLKPLQQNEVTERSQGKPLKLLFKEGLLLLSPTPSKTENEAASDDSKIDSEIEQIELEIGRLTSKLDALRLERAKKNLKDIESVKFVEEKQSTKNSTAPAKIDDPPPPATITGTKFRRRGISLGPSEITAGIRSRQTSKLEITPVQSIQNRRKSCFWKLEDIKEDEIRQRRQSFCSTPKSRSSKIQASKQALTTLGSKKSVKRDDSFMSSIQHKKLFLEEEKSVAAKKPLKPGRIVASRYNQISTQSTANPTKPDQIKRLWSENDKDDTKRCDKKRVSIGKSQGSQAEQGRRKSVVNGSQLSVLKMVDLLPRIKTVRCDDESPRDSGPAMRVADLTGGRSYFSPQETESETSVCQALSFDEEEEQQNGK